MSSSHSSLPSSSGEEELPADLYTDDLPTQEEQDIVHLVPCTWQEFLELDPPASGFYEYVDGFVIWCPNMADAVHVGLVNDHATVLTCSQDLKVVQCPSVQLRVDQNQIQTTTAHDEDSTDRNRASSSTDRNRASSSADRNRASSSTDRNRTSSSTDRNRASSSTDRNRASPSTDRNRASSSTDRNRASSSTDAVSIQSEMRHPDFVIEKLTSGASSTERDALSKKRVYYPLPLSARLAAAVEITSPSTRNTDLTAKWRAYARSGVPMYIIIDRGAENVRNKRVIVGTRDPLRTGDLQSMSGDTQVAPPSRRSQRRATEDSTTYYYRRVYSLHEIVDCPHYSQFNLTAEQLLDSQIMKNLAHDKDKDQRRQRRLRQEAEQKLDAEKKRGRDKDQKLRDKDRELDAEKKRGRDKDRELDAEKKRGRDKDQKLRDKDRELEQYRNQAAKNRGGSSSKSGSPDHKKSRP